MLVSRPQFARYAMIDPAGPIIVDGRGGLPTEIARALAKVSTRAVKYGPYAADAAEALASIDSTEAPGAVVLVAAEHISLAMTAGWQARGIPHLPVVCDDDAVIIGPLVVPTRGSCWRCRSLTLGELNPSRDVPALDTARMPVPLPRGSAGVLGAAIAASLIDGALSGPTNFAGLSTELAIREMKVTHRYWPRHPLCECHAPVTMVG